MRFLTAILALLSTAGSLTMIIPANSQAEEKDQYHLFNPTPREKMRDMYTDRPDKTESPYSVDAGHFQVESDIVTYIYDREAGSRAEQYGFAIPNVKIGLLNDVDLQLVPSTYLYRRLRQGGVRESDSGFGDLLARLKVNLWGNDGGATAFAMMPYIKIPTGRGSLSNDAYEGGLILPFAFSVGENNIGLMTQFDFLRNEDDKGYHTGFFNTATISRSLVGDLGGYAEIATFITNEDSSDFIATLDFGLTYLVNPDLQLDCGVNIGVTDAADDLNPFLGFTYRY